LFTPRNWDRKVRESLTNYEHVSIYNVDIQNCTAADLNGLVRGSTGDILCFLGPWLKPNCADWLQELVSFACQKGIAVVGGKVLNRKMEVCDGGIIVGTEGLVDVGHEGLRRDQPGNMFRNQMIGNFSAVSMSC